MMPRILLENPHQFIKTTTRTFERLKEMALYIDQNPGHFARGIVLR